MPQTNADLLAESVTTACRRFMQRVNVLFDELLTLEFLLEQSERNDFTQRLDKLPEALFDDLSLIFGATKLGGEVDQATHRLLTSALDFEQLMKRALHDMPERTQTMSKAIRLQDHIVKDTKVRLEYLRKSLMDQANDLIRASVTYIRCLD